MAEEQKKQETQEAPKPSGVPVETVEKLVEGFHDAVSKMQAHTAPPADLPVDNSASLAKAQDEYNAARERANTMAEEGDTAGATEEMYKAILAVQQATQGTPENSPQAKAMLSQAKRVAKVEHSEMFNSYGSEIEAAVNAMPIEERINPDAWDKAVLNVKANHIDEIMEQREKERTAAREKEQEELSSRTFDTPTARGGRVASSRGEEISADDLTQDQLDIATACRLTPEQYADAAKRYAAAPRSKHGVPVLDEAPHERPKPGKF